MRSIMLYLFKESNFCSAIWQIQRSALWCHGWYHCLQVNPRTCIHVAFFVMYMIYRSNTMYIHRSTFNWNPNNTLGQPDTRFALHSFSPLTPLHNGTIPCQRDLVSRNLAHNFNFLYQSDEKKIFSLHNNSKQVTTCQCIHYLTSWNLLMVSYSWNSLHAHLKGNYHGMTWAKYYKLITLFYE